jgi:plastocyanin
MMRRAILCGIASVVVLIGLSACGNAANTAADSTVVPASASPSPSTSTAPENSMAATSTPAAKETSAASTTTAPKASDSATSTPSAAPTTPKPVASLAAKPTPSPKETAEPVQPADVRAEASLWEWKLSQTEFKAGTPIHFSVLSKEGVHGFKIVGTDVNLIIAPNEDVKNVTWTPDKPGEYTIKCSQFCGEGHSTMETKIIVK